MGARSQAVAFWPQIQGTTDHTGKWSLLEDSSQFIKGSATMLRVSLSMHQCVYNLFPLAKLGRAGVFVYIESQALEEVRGIGRVYFWK